MVDSLVAYTKENYIKLKACVVIRLYKHSVKHMATINKDNKSFAKIMLKRGVLSFGSSLIAVLSFYEGITALLGKDANFIDDINLWIRIILWLLVSIIVSLFTLLITNIQLYNELNKKLDSQKQHNEKIEFELEEIKKNYSLLQSKNSDSICQLLNDAYEGRRYQEVIKIGMQLSEPLWYSGKYELRAKVGEFVESAAFRIGDQQTLAKVLIETIGWTNIRLGNNEIGIQTIKRGLNVAIEIEDNYWIASAYRNLADIHLGIATSNHSLRYSSAPITISVSEQQLEFEKCLEYLNLANDCIDKIKNDNKKNVLAGNIYYTYSKLFFETRDYDNALSYVDMAKNSYAKNNNIEKQIKLYNLEGEILLRIPSRKAEAINVFQEGLRKATDNNVNVHIVANALSLTDCFYDMKQTVQAERMLSTAEEYAPAVTDPLLLSKMQHLIAKVRSGE